MSRRRWLRHGLKALHQVAGIGIGGGLAACLVINLTVPPAPSPEFAAARQAVVAIGRYLLVPSLAVVVVSGLLAIAATRAYVDAGWAWVKALLGLVLFQATLVTVGAGRRHAEFAAAADPAVLAALLRSERNTLWLLLALTVANAVLAVWRPRLTPTLR